MLRYKVRLLFIPSMAMLVALGCDSPKRDAEDEDENEELITTAAGSCGVERWAVKTGTDSTVGTVNLTARATTIASLRALAKPSSIPSTTRVPGSAETQLWQLSATLTEFKLETDSDFHLVLSDASGATMIAEIPSPSCDSGSAWATQIASSRSAMTAKFTPSSSFQTANVAVTVTGVGMFDFAHGQTGAAPNQIELHPIHSICFPGSAVSGCTGGGGGGGGGSGSGSGSSCPASYTLKFNGHSYRAAASNAYANLVSSCHADGQHVIVINDSSENTWAMSQLTSSNNFVWVGLHFTSGVWTWDDGTPLGSGFQAFTSGVPTNPTNLCVNANQTDGSWLTFSCTASHPTLCECDGP